MQQKPFPNDHENRYILCRVEKILWIVQYSCPFFSFFGNIRGDLFLFICCLWLVLFFIATKFKSDIHNLTFIYFIKSLTNLYYIQRHLLSVFRISFFNPPLNVFFFACASSQSDITRNQKIGEYIKMIFLSIFTSFLLLNTLT